MRHALRANATTAVAVVALSACGGAPGAERDRDAASTTVCEQPTTLSFTADPGDDDEAYVCFGFDAARLAAPALGGVVWSAPDSSSSTLLHHATLYAVPADFPDGPAACDGMPAGAVGLHVWSPGGDNLDLPADAALAIPAGTRRFVVEAHVRRVHAGAATATSATLCAAATNAVHQAAFLGYAAPVPALRPMHDEQSDGSCELASDAHLWSVWPHMHLAGREISVRLRGSDGMDRPLIDVNPWSFHEQRTYRISVDAQAGDRLETHCRWHNGTSSYIFAGLRTEDEMCNAGLIVWPAEAAACR